MKIPVGKHAYPGFVRIADFDNVAPYHRRQSNGFRCQSCVEFKSGGEQLGQTFVVNQQMPLQNCFHHQIYPTHPAEPVSFHRLMSTGFDGASFDALHHQFGIQEVVLVHGTFLGSDPFGIAETLGAIADGVPALSVPLRAAMNALLERTKPLTDGITGDIANYTQDFADHFQQLVGDDPLITRLAPTWSGQNHHFARADLAVRLLCRLQERQVSEDSQAMIWGHSHAGNGMAILSNLLANDRDSVERFFTATAADHLPHWSNARQILAGSSSPHPIARGLTLVTFGTPVRYGWDTAGCRRLLHVLHHRNYSETNPARCQPMFPPQRLSDVLTARFGDWVQAFGIAGTDLDTYVTSTQNNRLKQILEADLIVPEHGLDTRFIRPEGIRNLCARWKTGTRCHADGRNLLVEYEPSGRKLLNAVPVEESLFGHGVYTTTDWLPAHLSLVMTEMTSQGLKP